MPKVIINNKGLVQESGSGLEVSSALGITSGDFFAGFIPDAASSTRADAGAVDVTSYFTNITTTGARALTLADGTVVGQRKLLLMSTDDGDATLTPTNFSNGTNLVFSAVGDMAELIWDGSNWALISSFNTVAGTAATPAVG